MHNTVQISTMLFSTQCVQATVYYTDTSTKINLKETKRSLEKTTLGSYEFNGTNSF